ncbi:hypothetical protein ACFL0G_02655 [Candidatus Zixiibacteriota bacterium]
MRLLSGFVAISCLLLMLFSCGPKVSRLETDPSLTPASLRTQQIGIGGVTSLIVCEPGSEMSGKDMSNLLRLCIMEKRVDLEVQPEERTRLAVGPGRYEKRLDTYRLTGEIEPEVLNEIDTLLQNAIRYLIFARVEGDVVERGTSETVNNQGEDDEYTEVKYTSKRTVTVSFVVYDLQQKIPVWSGLVSDDEANHKTHTIEEEDESFLGSVVKGVIGAVLFGDDDEDQGPYPDPPEFQQVLKKVFEGFALLLPGE